MDAALHDGSRIPVEIRGDGPTVLLPVNPVPVEGAQAEEMRRWGADPALGRTLIEGLSDRFRVVAFGYEDHVQRHPKPLTLTPAHIAADFLAIADAAGAERFAYYGYSWLALSGLQLAIRTDRLSALVMGGFPPIGGPYREMLAVTRATRKMANDGLSEGEKRANDPEPEHPVPNAAAAAPMDSAPAASSNWEDYDWSNVDIPMNAAQTEQFVTLYEHLQHFDDRAAQSRIRCPRLAFAGSADRIDYGARWGDVQVDIAGPLLRHREELEALGWKVRLSDGLDHTSAMQAKNVLPLIGPWLDRHLLRE
ncbi:alpha/beta fold hydrolase [Cohnella fermenti]|uniref:Alpha/beta hydrolase n=1 Tax=Cohnella fermenti TaxID=2565925 RepID=A0A4S4C6C3_9BACL|nr:alpha/beta hydrolase [Cohnella fermenti]THF83441.1 alpha/beta hydrolase [Cohnella fermenti]